MPDDQKLTFETSSHISRNSNANCAKVLRILVVTPVGLEGRGGIDRLNFYLSGWLKQNPATVEFTYLGSRGQWLGPFWLIHFFVALFKFTFLLTTRKFDVVHVHVSTDGSALRKVVFGRIARWLATPFLIHYHGMMSREILADNPLWLRALKVLARDAHRVIVLGHAFRSPFVDGLDIPASKVSIVHNGVPDIGADAIIPRQGSCPVRILFSGEVGERKGWTS